MPNRQVTFLINANAKAFKEGLKGAQSTFRRVGRKMERTGRKMTRNISAPLAAMGGLAIKAAGDFEDSFANIRKTVDTTEQQFGEISEGMRDMAKTIPTSVNELNRLGGVAGQLGIEAENIVGFTETLAKLADTTDVVGEQGALKLARFMNVMGTSQQDIDRLGSTIAGLGNNFAAMESEIVEISTSLSPLGNSIGLTEQQVLAFSGTIAASGGKAQAAATAFQKTGNVMKQAVIEGTEELDVFADTAGMTASEFQTAFQKDAAGALTSFLEGLRRVQQEGGSVATVLDKVGLADQRLVREFGKVLGNLDDLNKALPAANTYWEENTALTEEAQKRYATFNSRVQILWNNLKDLGITIGNTLMPVVDKLINSSQKAIDYFSGLNEETLRMGGVMAAVAMAIGPVLWGFGKLVGVMSALISPTAAVIGLFSGVVFSVQWLIDNWDGMKERMSDLFWWQNTLISMSQMVFEYGMFPSLLIKGWNEVIDYIVNLDWFQDTLLTMAQMAANFAPTQTLKAQFHASLEALKAADPEIDMPDVPNPYEGLANTLEALKAEQEEYHIELGGFADSAANALGLAKNTIINGLKGILNSEQIQSLIAQINQMTSAPAQGGDSEGSGGEQRNIGSASIDTSGFSQLGSDLSGVPDIIKNMNDQLDVSKKVLGDATDKAKVMGQALQSTVTNAITDFATTIGNVMTGDAGVEGVFNNLLMIVVDFANKFGKLLIGAGVAALAFKSLIANPVAAIAAGTALVAATTAVKNLLQKGPEQEGETGTPKVPGMAQGGIIPSGFPDDTYPAMLTSGEMVVPQPKALPNNFGGRGQVIENVVNIDGQEIYRNQKEVKYENER